MVPRTKHWEASETTVFTVAGYAAGWSGRGSQEGPLKRTKNRAGSLLNALLRLFTLPYGGDEINRIAEPDNSSPQEAANGTKFGLEGLNRFSRFSRFPFGFRKCGFSRENGKKFGLVGFYRFPLGRRKLNRCVGVSAYRRNECGALPRRRYARKQSQTSSYKGLRLIDRSGGFP